MADLDEFRRLLEASSLGDPEARAAIARNRHWSQAFPDRWTRHPARNWDGRRGPSHRAQHKHSAISTIRMEPVKLSDPTLCVYHGNCPDGFGAAWTICEALGDIAFHAGVCSAHPPEGPSVNCPIHGDPEHLAHGPNEYCRYCIPPWNEALPWGNAWAYDHGEIVVDQ